ncbi:MULTISPECIES: hypothetical protein [unclassified Pseudonocardia]|uniref:hypothetical protein n=1 Tax=unclassified Pseudonocardia TaxID=2619320 RepID=UPI0009615434|nr:MULTISPECIES: hypothetical protein [unclassified Pseudonocardia]MBN9103124.1 hypothetical protein [Pseudonocardia sp.]OJY41598.1 MAG: hypothetical protein BGP03_20595 [Pseudonocardia sp. 73-21]
MTLVVPDGPVPRSWGWPLRDGGRAAHVEAGTRFAGTTSQVCGLFPFAVASGADVDGVPIGRHMHTAEPVGLDPAEWLRTGLVSNTAVWVQGQPGIGKSSITKRMITGLVGFGMKAVIPGDVKGEYSALITALGGTVWRIGRGLHALNPLDAGPLRAALAQATGEDRHRVQETVRARRLSLLEALITIVRRGEITVTERRLLGVALDTADAAARTEPVIPDVLAAIATGADPLQRIAAGVDEADYRRTTRDLVNSLGLLCEGAIRGIFDRPSTVTSNDETPALSLDISALDDDEDDVVAAAMLCSWAWSAGLVDAAATGTPRRNVVQVQDELWRALRVAPGLVEKSDRITRLGRHRGVVSFQITHSLDDLEALPTEADRAKARGLASRSGVLLLGGMAERELDGLRRIVPLTVGEAALVTSWAAPPTWHAGRAHPGRGKYLIKSGQRMGLPVALTLTPTEAELYDTDGAFRTEIGR